MAKFYFIRHAEKDYPDELICGNQPDIPLTDLGHRQATQRTEHFLKEGIRPDHIYASLAYRAIDTAQPSVRAFGVGLRYDARLAEMSQGVLEGKNRQEVYTPELQAAIKCNRANHRSLGGESLAQVQSRKVKWLREKMQEHEGQTVFAFGHGLAIKALAGFVRGVSFDELLTWRVGYTGYVVIESDVNAKSGLAVTDAVDCELSFL